MASAYPGGLDAFPTNRTNATPMVTVHPSDHNNHADAINKIEATLGVDPQGSFATVVERLDNGGSQTGVRVVGPFPLEWTEFVEEDDEKILFTSTAGDVLLDAFVDVATAVNFDDSGSIDLSFNETPPDPDFSSGSDGFWGFLVNSVEAPDGGAGNSAGPNTQLNAIGSVGQNAPMRVFVGNPVKVRAQSVVGDGSQGHIDLYFVIATPVAP